MAAELENLVATATEKELLEKELAIARELQRSLIPHDLPAGGAVEFSMLFAPSAAIGGDYFDVFRIGEDRLAVMVADVSGHGLSTGLRMAMIKAALTILIEERRPADEILRRLHGLVRGGNDRMFVTATLALIDPATGEVDLTNAGHPPTYVIHDGEVEEVVLPGSPLGGLDTRHGRRRLELAPGDVVVWLSDGLIEATDAEQSTFGYDGVAAALRGPCGSADEVRDRLLAAVERHTGGRPIEDDRTVVAMRWRGGGSDGDAGPPAP
jgi:sigma-B regulation protein RsbU (phosphoserine phosphatase)